MSKSLPIKYRIADISISADGKTFWIGYAGEHADQGGNTLRWGNVGVSSLEGALALLKHELEANIALIQEQLTERGA